MLVVKRCEYRCMFESPCKRKAAMVVRYDNTDDETPPHKAMCKTHGKRLLNNKHLDVKLSRRSHMERVKRCASRIRGGHRCSRPSVVLMGLTEKKTVGFCRPHYFTTSVPAYARVHGSA